MVEAFAVASGKGGTGKTTATLAIGMALADRYDVTVIDADTGMANLLFHAGLADVETTLHDLLVEGTDTDVADAVYERYGMKVVPCGTDLAGFESADPDRLREVVATLAADTEVILLDSPATLGSKSAVLPVVLADRVILVLQPTVPALSDGLKVQEYARSYGTGIVGLVFNKVHDRESIETVGDRADRYFDGPVLGTVPEDDAARTARRAGEPLLAHSPNSPAARAFAAVGATIQVDGGTGAEVADRFRSAVIPEPP